ncbi:efflux RND transporter permease subunit [Ructibacterium gallinarum]|nr:MMPL family transporter [Ructibacterium gallinarum]
MKRENNMMERAATFIVDKRKAVYIVFALALFFSVLSIPKVRVNNDITSYLPTDTETRQSIEIMKQEFVTYDTAKLMITNTTAEIAGQIAERLRQVEGIKSVIFETNSDYFRKSSALLEITLDTMDDNEEKLEILDRIREMVSDYDCYIYSATIDDSTRRIAQEMNMILVYAMIVIIAVLLFTSQSFMEVPVFLIVFGVSAVLNMGTNVIFGEISYITNSIAVVLQLALAIDYAIILSHRFAEEKEGKSAYDAIVAALSKAIIEISSSSLTTIAGLAALMVMQLKIGMDMGLVLCKGILCSLLTVFLLMPGLLLMFSKWIDKTSHRSFVPNIDWFGRWMLRARYVIPVIFAVITAACIYFSSQCDYAFDTNSIQARKRNEDSLAQQKIQETFDTDNTLALIVPKGEYEKEAKVLEVVGQKSGVTSAQGLANTKINDSYGLTDAITPRQFAELTGIDIEVSRLLFQAYGASHEQYQAIFQNVDEYRVRILELFLFVHEQMDLGVISLEPDMTETVNNLYDTLSDARAQLEGENYARLIFTYSGDIESEENVQLMEEIRKEAKRYYSNPILASNTISSQDLKGSFTGDNNKINLLTLLAVIVILLFTFQSSVVPFILVLTIQGSIWMNFSFPYLTGTKLYFLGYLVVSSIQMGATIDYAIVFANRYLELKKTMDPQKAAVQALNEAFPTVFTSGSIMTVAGFLIGFKSSDPTIGSLGLCLGRGTLISIILVMLVLPQLMVLCDKLIEKGAFARMKDKPSRADESGIMYVNGRVHGYINGYVDGSVHGMIRGEIHARVDSGAKIQTSPKLPDGQHEVLKTGKGEVKS